MGAAVGVYMVGVPFRELLQKFLLYQVHKTIGITVFLLVLTQVVLLLHPLQTVYHAAVLIHGALGQPGRT